MFNKPKIWSGLESGVRSGLESPGAASLNPANSPSWTDHIWAIDWLTISTNDSLQSERNQQKLYLAPVWKGKLVMIHLIFRNHLVNHKK